MNTLTAISSLPHEGDMFATFEDANHAITELGVFHSFSPGIKKKDKTRIIWFCRSSKTCEWHARAWKGSGSLIKLVRLGELATHSCVGSIDPFRPPFAQNSFLVKAIDQRMTVNAETSAREIGDVLLKNLRIKPTYAAIYKAKRALPGDRDAELRLQVWQLPAYLTKLGEVDRDNFAIIEPEPREDDGVRQFERCFVAPAAARAAFKFCRPFVALDGTFLKGRIKLVLLLAATFDSNDSLVILAWGLVKVENEDNWTWFISQLLEAMPEMGSSTTTIVSDRDKGLLNDVSSQLSDIVFPFSATM
ncbi:unnamed protein product [Tilletia caries]|uniref:MULE transposase domain-containing protein n=1 Tax=Tilletia caries TaxID=13290 RepID=A0ABN7IJ34_9BASI|nr:unnamed protein product [Tilletia caries]